MSTGSSLPMCRTLGNTLPMPGSSPALTPAATPHLAGAGRVSLFSSRSLSASYDTSRLDCITYTCMSDVCNVMYTHYIIYSHIYIFTYIYIYIYIYIYMCIPLHMMCLYDALHHTRAYGFRSLLSPSPSCPFAHSNSNRASSSSSNSHSNSNNNDNNNNDNNSNHN